MAEIITGACVMNHLKSLVLNSAYEPLQFTNTRRAFVLVLLGKAEAIEQDGFYLRTPTTRYRLPTVIKLNRYVRRPNMRGVSFSKRNVLRRDGHTCQYCGYKGSDLTIDHVVPRSLGGGTDWGNVVAACRRCNLKKGARTPTDARLILKAKPIRPDALMFSAYPGAAPSEHAKTWAKYLPKKKSRP